MFILSAKLKGNAAIYLVTIELKAALLKEMNTFPVTQRSTRYKLQLDVSSQNLLKILALHSNMIPSSSYTG